MVSYFFLYPKIAFIIIVFIRTRETINLVHSVPKTGNKLFYFNRLCELLKTSPHASSTFPIHFWLRLADNLYDICKMPRESFSDFREDALFFLTWIFGCNKIEEILEVSLV